MVRIEIVKELTLDELFELLGSRVDNAACVHTSQPQIEDEDEASEDDEETEDVTFDIVLVDYGSNKIATFKAVRELTGLNLREAKELVEDAPIAVLEDVKVDEVIDAKVLLMKAGAEVTLG